MKFEHYRNRVILIWGTADCETCKTTTWTVKFLQTDCKMKKERKDKKRKEKELNEG